MDGLEEQEIEGIWQRIKTYIDLKKIKSVDAINQKEELARVMGISTPSDGKNPQSNMNFLVNRGFPKEAIQNEKIRNEILSNSIVGLKVKGVQRFQIAKGAKSFISNGRTIKAGQFLKGTTKESALKGLGGL